MEHPITPPPELVQQWDKEAAIAAMPDPIYIATQAARWAADAELEACCEWVSQWCGRWPDGTRPEDGLRAARRPKPPSIKKQAIDALEASLRNGYIKAKNGVIILRALESLPNPQD